MTGSSTLVVTRLDRTPEDTPAVGPLIWLRRNIVSRGGSAEGAHTGSCRAHIAGDTRAPDVQHEPGRSSDNCFLTADHFPAAGAEQASHEGPSTVDHLRRCHRCRVSDRRRDDSSQEEATTKDEGTSQITSAIKANSNSGSAQRVTSLAGISRSISGAGSTACRGARSSDYPAAGSSVRAHVGANSGRKRR
jgi:hypothetical protein